MTNTIHRHTELLPRSTLAMHVECAHHADVLLPPLRRCLACRTSAAHVLRCARKATSFAIILARTRPALDGYAQGAAAHGLLNHTARALTPKAV